MLHQPANSSSPNQLSTDNNRRRIEWVLDAMSLVSNAVRLTCQSRAASRLAPQYLRWLHLAPPFLLDDYTPRYQMLSSRDEAKKHSLAYSHLRNCNLCPRMCGVNRYETTGMCLIGDNVKVNVIAPHFGEGLPTTLDDTTHTKSADI